MAVTRSLLKSMGLTDEQVSTVIDAHTETVDGLKADRDKYKAEAEKLKDVQKELETLKGGEDWHSKYTDLEKTFKDYKAEVNGREKTEKVKAAYRKLLEDANVDQNRIDAIMRITDTKDFKLKDDGTLDGADKLSEDIKSEWSAFIVKQSTRGTGVETPPGNAGDKAKMTKADIMAIPDRAERRKAIAEHPDLFGITLSQPTV